MRIAALLVISFCLCGCLRMTGLEHTLYGGVARSHSGGEIYSESPSGHEEQSGSWHIGSSLKTIWAVSR